MDYIYSVSMCATIDTYVYGIYRFDGVHVRFGELTFGELAEIHPGLRNNAGALVWLNANAADVFDAIETFDIT